MSEPAYSARRGPWRSRPYVQENATGRLWAQCESMADAETIAAALNQYVPSCPSCGVKWVPESDRNGCWACGYEKESNGEALNRAESLNVAFVQGASWWEYHQAKATMWQSDRRLAEEEAARREQNGTLGVIPNMEQLDATPDSNGGEGES